MKLSRVSRILHIMTALQSGQKIQVDNLAKMHNLSRRTIFRDLKELKAIGVQYNYDSMTRCYTVDEDFFLPPANLSREEAMALLLTAYKLRHHMTMPFKKATLLAAMKLENNLPIKIRSYCNDALLKIYIRPEPQAKINSLDQIFTLLLQAILKKRIVNICYDLPRHRDSVLIDLCPYHLMFGNSTWYVVGKSSLRRRVRAFKLSRIKAINMLHKCFIADEKFDIREFVGRAWSIMPEGKLYNVKLRFLPEVAHDVAEVQWHSTQTVTFENDGSAIIEFRLDGLDEITWWILSHGDRVRVLAPNVLRQRVAKIARKMVTANR
jgi:predicted DNA-binding transcriptional regulator YafY